METSDGKPAKCRNLTESVPHGECVSLDIKSHIPRIQNISQRTRPFGCRMENPNQVSEQCFPDTKLKLVKKVDDHHPRNIKFLPGLLESFIKGILCDTRSNHAS